jgi:allantoinase
MEDFPYADVETLRLGMTRAAALGLPVAVHAEDPQLTTRLTREAVEHNRRSPAEYVATRPIQAEVNAVALAVALAVATGCSLHVVHASSEIAVGRCRIGTRLGSITCETCPHYLWFIDEDLANVGARLKCAPPLRPYPSVRALQACLSDGLIAFVASDHSPAPPSMKTGDDFLKVWGGVAGVQSTLPAVLTLTPPLEPHAVARLTASAAAARFGLTPNKGMIHPGYDADVALVDLGRTFELRREDLLDRHKLSPYVGRTFRGVVRRTILRGQTIFMDGKVVRPPAGRFVRPAR